MRTLNFIIGGLLACAMAFGVVSSYAQTTVLGPFVTVTTTTSGTPIQQIVSQNSSRKSIQVCNVGTNVVWIWPGPVASSATAVSMLELPALSSGTTVCYSPPSGVTGGMGSAWNMESVTSGVGTVSVIEY